MVMDAPMAIPTETKQVPRARHKLHGHETGTMVKPRDTAATSIRQTQILSALFSPSFPIGAFAFSHGLEAAIEAGWVVDVHTAENWIRSCLLSGSGRNDALIFAHAWRATADRVQVLNDLAFALCSSAERAQEMRELGENFRRVTQQVYAVTFDAHGPASYPVITGLATRQLDCDLSESLVFFLQSFVGNLISVAVRTVPIGQSDGQAILRRVMPDVERLAAETVDGSLDQLGGHAFLADHAAMRHESMETRIYRT